LTSANQLGCTDVPGLSVTWSKTTSTERVSCLSSSLCDVKRKTGSESAPEATLVGQASTPFRQE